MDKYFGDTANVKLRPPGLVARKSGLAEAVNRPNLTFAISPKYLSSETKIYIFITRIPRVVYRISFRFFKIQILIFPPLVDILQTSALSSGMQVEATLVLEMDLSKIDEG